MKTVLAAGFLAMSLLGQSAARDAAGVIEAASKALGAAGLSSIQFSGSAVAVNFLQTRSLEGPWPARPITEYTRTIDFTQPASRATGVTRNPDGVYSQLITPGAAWAQQLELYLTPWGFVQGAAANHASLREQKSGDKTHQVLSWSPAQKAPSGAAYKVNGYLDDHQLVTRIETWIEHPTLGDLHVEAVFRDYKDFSGVMVPAMITEKRAEWPVFEVQISHATPNPPGIAESLTASPAAPPPQPAPPVVQSEKLADGVYRITGGYVSLAVEFKNYILVLEGGQTEARGLAVIAETKRLFPNKPIRYVFNSHPHSDHTAGLAPFASQGATIITQQNNRSYLEGALSAPRTLLHDTLAQSGKKPKFETVAEKRVLKDSTRTVEFHHITGLSHSDGMLIAYLPREKVLFQADFALPAAGQPASESLVTLVANLDRLSLWDFDRYVPVHAPNPDVPWTKADLRNAVPAAQASACEARLSLRSARLRFGLYLDAAC
jgi:glyoxylase-like metal-dependent hydrolase (beta-lactamase superfamily II)